MSLSLVLVSPPSHRDNLMAYAVIVDPTLCRKSTEISANLGGKPLGKTANGMPRRGPLASAALSLISHYQN